MQIKNQIENSILIAILLFVGLQAFVILGPWGKGPDLTKQASTQLLAESSSLAMEKVETQEPQAQLDNIENTVLENTEAVEDQNSPAEESQDEKPTDEVKAPETESQPLSSYFLHQNIITTYFWAGEGASDDNGGISNSASAWDEKWAKHFGGEDDPRKRNGYFPAKFTPKENPFYFALPYNDFGSNGKRRTDANSVIPWAKSRSWKSSESMCKNQWIRIVKGSKVAYAQWEDVGPFEEKDAAYVFGTAKPKNKDHSKAGLDVSPAVRDYLGLSDVDKVDWQFINAGSVPPGPWKQIITTSQIYWR